MKNSIKREQSQACLNFAERKNFRLQAKYKIIMTLALLLTAVTGAWADETPLVTITFDSNGPVYSVEGLVTLTGTNYHLGNSSGVYFWEPNSPTKTLSATVEAVADNVSISKVVFRSIMYDNVDIPLEDTEKPFVCYANYDLGGRSLSETNWTNKIASERIAKIEVYTGAAEAPITVEPVTGQSNQWTFAMPGSDVVLTPIYAKAAAFATTGTEPEVKTLLPEAAEGVIAGTDASLIAEGTGIVAFAGTSTEVKQGTLMYAIGTSATEVPALTAFSATVPTAEDYDDAATVYVWYYIKGADAPQGQTATAENTFDNTEPACLTVTVLTNKFDIQFNAANANTIEAGKATVTVGGTAATVTEGKLEGVKMGSEVKLKAKEGYKFRKVEVKKGGGEPVLLTTITAADNSSFKSGSQTFGDVATVTLTGDYLTNDGSHGGWYCLGSNLTATISVAEANGANITSVKFYTAGGGSAEDKDAPFEVTTTSVTSSNITTYLNGNSIGSYGVSKIEVYGTK